MTIQATTRDCSALGDGELAEMADLTTATVGWEAGQLGKQAEEWVLVTTATRQDRLRGFLFVTLERIGGTPAMVVGLGATARDRSSSSVLRAMMADQYHRALMAFPDEDVLVAARVVDVGAMELFDKLSDFCPTAGARVNGEQRAWGRRLSKRFGALDFDDRTMLASGDGPALVVDHTPGGKAKLPEPCDALDGGAAPDDFVIAWGWAMTEFLETFR